MARSIEKRPVQPNRERNSVGAEDIFMTDIFDLNAARPEKVWRHCEAKQLTGSL
jgi:DNA polymerase-4